MADSSDLTITEGVFRRIKRGQVSNLMEIRSLVSFERENFPAPPKNFSAFAQKWLCFPWFS
jgi:hypothetical protein